MRKILLLAILTLSTYLAYSNATVAQGNWRWRRDNGSETAATWAAVQDQGLTMVNCQINENIRLRMGFQVAPDPSTTNPASKSTDYHISYSTSPSGPWTVINTNTANAFVQASSQYVTDGTLTTQQLTSSSSGSYALGQVIDQTHTSSILFSTPSGVNTITEYEWVIKPTENATPGTTYYFQLGGLNSYPNTLPGLTIAAPVSGTTVVTNVACNGGSNGSINLTPSGGTPPYTFNWGGGITTEDRTGLAAGNYTVVITDNNGCTETVSTSVTQPAAFSISTAQANVSCFGASNGAAAVSVSGGTPPYTYSWAPSGGTNATASGRPAGIYTVTITDANGCIATRTFTLTQPAAPVSGTTVVTNVACNGGSNGSINLTPSGGTPPYTFNWGGGITTEDRTGLTAGTYTVTIIDNNGCIGTISNIQVGQQAASVSGTTVVTNVACNGGSNGSINLTPSGGTPPYTFNWGGGITTEDRTGLTADTYTVIITDANGCTGTISNIQVTQPISPVSGSTVVTNVACNGGSNGSINLTPSGGTAPYTYNWGGGITTEDRTGLSAGAYTVLITDNNGCTGTVQATVTQPPKLSASVTTNKDISCSGASDGSATVTPSGGTPGYTYSWSPSGGTGATVSARDAGTYIVTVTDANGCTTTGTVVFTNPPALVATTSQQNVSCFGGTDGSATINVSGGTGPYTYMWSPSGGTGATASGLSAGNYSVIATDKNGCMQGRQYIITQPTSPVSGSTVVTNVTCNGGSNGSINLTPSGGTAPYTYNWGGGITTEDRIGLAAGNYSVVITDANGCTATVQASVKVVDNQAPIINTITSPIVLLWSPNHKYQNVKASQFVNSITENCGTISKDNVVITKVTSDEPDDAPGKADGATTQDIKIASGCKTVDLRSERIEGGNGRVYTVYLQVKDASGNTSAIVTGKAIAAANQNGTTAVDNGVAYTVTGSCNTVNILTKNMADQPSEEEQGLQVRALPNPSTTYFTLQIRSNSDKAVQLRIVDGLGRIVEGKAGIAANSTQRIGQSYRPGVYFAQVVQEGKTVTLKLVKQGC